MWLKQICKQKKYRLRKLAGILGREYTGFIQGLNDGSLSLKFSELCTISKELEIIIAVDGDNIIALDLEKYRQLRGININLVVERDL